MSRDIKLTRQEKEIERSLLGGELIALDKAELEEISEAIARRKKDAILNVRVNSRDLQSIKRKAKKLGIKYQTFISEILHKVALW